MDKFIEKISYIVATKFEENGYDKQYGKVNVSNRPDLCQFQCNGALAAAKKYGKAPRNIAEEVVESLNALNIFDEISIAGPGFINIKVKDEVLVKYVNDMAKDKKCGVSNAENPMSIVVDYGGANVAKPLHVGHLRPAIIGETIKRTAKFLGHNVIGDVHLGDWGLQIGMVITEVKRRQPDLPYFDESFTGEYPEEAPFTIDELEDIYPKASKLAKSDENAMLEAREATVELQQGRRGYRALWKHILNVSVTDLKKNYDNLNVHFDLWKGESDAQEDIPDMVKYLKDNGYTKESEGALIVDVEEETDKAPVPPFLVLKSDGASLYGTTDLATIVQRVRDYNPDEIIYLADKRQSLHFKQLFRCAKKTHIFDENKTLDYIGFGTMNDKDGKPFKTRAGGVMRLHDLIDKINMAVKDKIEDNNSVEADKVEDTARIVGLAALKYGDLSNQATKDYIFDIDRFAAFEGNTGPYILYTVVRIKSILSKVNATGEEVIVKPYSDVERDLMLKLTKFNEVIEASYAERAPHKICEYIYDLSNVFNRFYNSNKIVTEEDKEKQSSWIAMITLVKRVLEACLDLLGIEVPEKM